MTTDGNHAPEPSDGGTPRPDGQQPAARPDWTGAQYPDAGASPDPTAPYPPQVPQPDAGSQYPSAPQYQGGAAQPGAAAQYPTPGGGPYPGTAAPQYPGPGYGPGAGRTDGVSITALVTGILTIGPVAIVLGILGLRRTKGGARKGHGLALAGLILGVLSTIGWIVTIILILIVVNSYNDRIADLRVECTSGDLQSCDDLYRAAVGGSEDETFGSTCGDRSDENLYGTCSLYKLDDNNELVNPFGSWDYSSGSDISMSEAESYGDNDLLDSYYDSCADGDDSACDTLYIVAAPGSDYEEFADTCGGTVTADDSESYCGS